MRKRVTIRVGVATVAALFLAALINFPLALAPRAEAFVYWANPDAIGRANLDGTDATHHFIPEADLSPGVAVDASHIYWGAFPIGRANLNGKKADHFFIDAKASTGGIAVDASHIYWAEPLDGRIGRANLDGTGVEKDFIAGANFPEAVAVDASHIYWANNFSNTIGRATLDGMGVDQSFIPATGLDPDGVAVDSSHIYWSSLPGIGRANLDGTGVDQTFIDADASGVAVDASHIYWTGFDTIGRANLDGTGVDEYFICGVEVQGSPAVDALTAPSPLNDLSFCGVKKNKTNGTATLTAKVAGPGTLDLAKTKKVKGAKARAEEKGFVTLPVKPNGEAKRTLNKEGKAKVQAKVTYTPDGGTANTESTKIGLVKKG